MHTYFILTNWTTLECGPLFAEQNIFARKSLSENWKQTFGAKNWFLPLITADVQTNLDFKASIQVGGITAPP